VRYRFAILAALCLLPALTAPVQGGVILNTLAGYDQREPGWSGKIDGLFSGSGGNTERIIFSAGGQVQWRGEVNRWCLQSVGAYEESAGRETARNVVVHLRHNRDLSEAWASILFAQVQHNPFQRLESRWLFGAGARVNVRDDEQGRIGIGLTPMLELERIDGEPGHHTRGRLSAFVHVAQHLNDRTRLDLTAFWQPLFSDIQAWRAVGNVALVVEINGHLDLKLGAAVEDDARAPAGVERTDWSTYAGLSWSF